MSREMKDSGVEWIGMIPVDWRVIKNKYVLKDMYSGGTPTASDERFYSLTEGVPFIGIGDMSSTPFIMKSKKMVTDLGIQDKRLRILDEGSILYSIYATIGAVSELKIKATISQAMLALTLKSSFDKRFYKYNLLAMRDYIYFNANGNTQFNLNAEAVRNFWLCFPQLQQQKRISNFLDAQCVEIDSVLIRTRASIEEYKKLKQAVITQAVTKGIRGKRPMKDSGVEWIGSIPEDWKVFRVANLYQEASDKGNDELPILTVSINSGVSDRELSDEESERVFVRSEDRSKYKRVQPGDLVYNMMRAWQGAFGAVRVDGMVSPAYVVARPMEQLDSRYVEYLFRTPEAIEEMHRYSYGVADFRLRLYWPQFRNIRMCVPSYEEQVEIADYIDSKVQEILALIQKKEQYLVELENYKKSLIYEYVTGKKEVLNHGA